MRILVRMDHERGCMTVVTPAPSKITVMKGEGWWTFPATREHVFPIADISCLQQLLIEMDDPDVAHVVGQKGHS